MTNQLYDLGYNDLKKAEELKQVAEALGAIVADIRFMPNTRNPEFSQTHLQEVLGEKYTHIHALGNKNYKGEGETQLADADKGMDELHDLLEKSNVIIMCACWKRSDCHRLDVAGEYKKRHDVEITPITRSEARAILAEAASKNNPQMSLFPEE